LLLFLSRRSHPLEKTVCRAILRYTLWTSKPVATLRGRYYADSFPAFCVIYLLYCLRRSTAYFSVTVTDFGGSSIIVHRGGSHHHNTLRGVAVVCQIALCLSESVVVSLRALLFSHTSTKGLYMCVRKIGRGEICLTQAVTCETATKSPCPMRTATRPTRSERTARSLLAVSSQERLLQSLSGSNKTKRERKSKPTTDGNHENWKELGGCSSTLHDRVQATD
jgi:hypothetical protein